MSPCTAAFILNFDLMFDPSELNISPIYQEGGVAHTLLPPPIFLLHTLLLLYVSK